jgi:hypothetical protein
MRKEEGMSVDRLKAGASLGGLLGAAWGAYCWNELSTIGRVATAVAAPLSLVGLLYHPAKSDKELKVPDDFPLWPAGVISALGGKEAWCKLPVLDPGNRDHVYVDFISASTMTAPIMRGVVTSGRPFVAFRCRLKDLDTLKPTEDFRKWVETVHADGKLPTVTTVFRRYDPSKTDARWTCAYSGLSGAVFNSTLFHDGKDGQEELKAFIENSGNATYELW